MEEIHVTVGQQYGNTVFRPANTGAHILASIAGTKTLTSQTLLHAKSLGLKVVAEPAQSLAAAAYEVADRFCTQINGE